MPESVRCTLLILLASSVLYCCDSNRAQQVVDKAIEAHGGEKFQQVKVEFDFRGRHYTSMRNQGKYTYTREFTDSTGRVNDVLTNDSFHREINGNRATITDERARAFRIREPVVYFAVSLGVKRSCSEKSISARPN